MSSQASTIALTRPAPTHAIVTRGDLSGRIAGVVLIGIVVVLAAVAPFNLSLGQLTQLVDLFALVILGTTWNLLAGYGGLLSVGQQAFVGIGGYALIVLADSVGLPLIGAVIVSALICAAFALPASFLLFRLSGGYFAIGTWVVAEVVKIVVSQSQALGSGIGLHLSVFDGVAKALRVGTVYWLALALAVVVVVGTYMLMRSRVGLGLSAIRDEPVAAATAGVRVTRGRRIVYLSAAAGAGIAGALYALNTMQVSPESSFSVGYSTAMIFIVVIGGIGTIEGPIVGAVVYWVLQNQLAGIGPWYLTILGIIAVAFVFIAPQGIWGLLTRGRLHVFPVHYALRPVPGPSAAISDTGQ